MAPHHAAVLVSVLGLAGCAAPTVEGLGSYRVRTGDLRFDETSLTSTQAAIGRSSDGHWRGMSHGQPVDVVEDGDVIRVLGSTAWVKVVRRASGLRYVPSWTDAGAWTFVTEDGAPIARELEIPLFLASRSIGGQVVTLMYMTPTGPTVDPDCRLIVFEMDHRRVALWLPRRGARCPSDQFPLEPALTRILAATGDVWESPKRPAP